MNLSALWRNPFAKTKSPTSPAQFLFVSVPLMVIVLAILVMAFQVNRQLFDQEKVVVGQLANTAARQISLLQREHLRLYATIEGTRMTLNETKFQLQQNLVQSRINILRNTILTGDTSPEMADFFTNYVESWQILQPQMTLWQADPQDIVLQEHIAEAMEKAELSINQISTLAQLAFEDRMVDWADKSRFLNRLLALSRFSFALIIGVVLYTSYLFLKNQTVNEQTLRASEQRLRAILDIIPDAVYRINRAGFYTDYKPPVNAAYCLPKDAFNGKSLHDALPADAATLVQNGILSVLDSGEQMILELALADPQTEEIILYENRLLPSGKDEVQIIARDITLEKQQEAAILQAQKLESLGVLAGGIAHDFNNLLTAMLGQASLAATKLERGLPASENIRKVILSAERAADLTRQLLAYTGKGKFEIGPLDINQLIRDTTGLMETALPTHATLQLELQADLPLIQSDRPQIQQVVMNLFINAIEALSMQEGAITISTSTRQVQAHSFNHLSSTENQITSGALESGQYVVIEVADTGTGMDQATMHRIFDPFFTTKPKGHGLGLSATLGIIRTHHGALQVQSQPGAGTTFAILLPALAPVETAPQEEIVFVAPDPDAVQKTILIIDDEAPVREVAADILGEHGYSVVVAASGQEGVDLLRKHLRTVGVVLLDMKMPGMNGEETYQALGQIQPDIKVIFTSGYSESAVAALISRSEQLAFLPKPYTAPSLIKQISQMLLL